MRKRSTYTTLTLELRTSASTVAIAHVCQLLYQEFEPRMPYVHVPEARGNHRDNEQTAKRVSELMHCSLCIAPSTLLS